MGRRVRDMATPTVGSPTRASSYTTIRYADDLAQTRAGSVTVDSFPESLSEPCLFASVGRA